MAKIINQELRELSTDELKLRIAEERMNLRRLRFQKAVSTDAVVNLKETKRTIARALTELRAREIAESNQKK